MVSFELQAVGLSFLWRVRQYISMNTEGGAKNTLGLELQVL